MSVKSTSGQIISPEPLETRNLDAVDTKILQVLGQDSRASYSKVAKFARISPESARYRMKRLEKQGVIIEYFTLTDTIALGFIRVNLYMSFNNLTVEKEAEILKQLAHHNYVSWVISSSGSYDIVTEVYATDILHFEQLLGELWKDLKPHVNAIDVHIVTQLDHKGSAAVAGGESHDQSKTQTAATFDKTDIEILSLLDINARMSFLDIGKATDLTLDAIRYRLKRLKEKGIIKGFHTRTNNFILGYQYAALLCKTANLEPSTIRKFSQLLQEHKNVNGVFRMIGEYQFQLQVYSKNNTELRMITNEIKSIIGDALSEIEVLNLYNQYKWTYLPQGVIESLHTKCSIISSKK